MNNLSIGLQLTVIGMGLVFLLLAILGVLIVVLLRLDGRKTARPGQGQSLTDASANDAEASDAAAAVTAQDSVTVTPVDRGATSELSPEMLAAVMVAVRMHRRIRRKQAAPAMRLHQPGTLPSRWVGAGRTSQNQIWQPRRR